MPGFGTCSRLAGLDRIDQVARICMGCAVWWSWCADLRGGRCVVHISSETALTKPAAGLLQGSGEGDRSGRLAGVQAVDTCDNGEVTGGQHRLQEKARWVSFRWKTCQAFRRKTCVRSDGLTGGRKVV